MWLVVDLFHMVVILFKHWGQCASDICCSYGSSFPFRSIHGYGSHACSSTALSAIHVDYSKKLKLKHDIQLDSSAALRVGPADTVDGGSNKSNYNSEKATPVTYAKPLRLPTSNASGLTLDGYHLEHDETSNNDVLCNLCENGKLMEACNLVDVMARLSQVPDLRSCINLIRGLINVDRIEKAIRVLQVMILSGGVPDIITYNKLIGGLCRRGQLNSAIKLVEDMGFCGCPPDVITFNTLFRSMFEHGKYDEAIWFWKNQLRKGYPPYLISYTILLELVCKNCGIRRAMTAMEDLAFDGCHPDLVTFNSLINLICKRGKFEDVAMVVGGLKSHGLEPNAVTYNTLLHSFCIKGKWAEADDMLCIMKKASYPPTVVTYNILINSLCKYQILDRAIDVLHKMLNEGCSPDIVTYNTLLASMCKVDMTEEALNILHSLRDNGYSLVVISYNTLIDGLAKKGEIKKAMVLFNEMVSDGIAPDDITYGSLVMGFCKQDMVHEAVEILQGMVKINCRIRGSTFTLVIQALCRNGQLDTAIEIVSIMVSRYSKASKAVYTSLVRGVAASGLTEAATKLREARAECRRWHNAKNHRFVGFVHNIQFPPGVSYLITLDINIVSRPQPNQQRCSGFFGHCTLYSSSSAACDDGLVLLSSLAGGADVGAFDLELLTEPPALEEPLFFFRCDCLGMAGMSCPGESDGPTASFLRGFRLRRDASVESRPGESPGMLPSDWCRLECLGLVDAGSKSGESGDGSTAEALSFELPAACRTDESSIPPPLANSATAIASYTNSQQSSKQK
ncbi:hypothetical protein OPV22_001114 [Ensete ventricosum]|uniref:Pentatricopeptide repeat-containing protein n=1 Tax=Ensete ventricosum TaxID=4639 RepID=A0AAV8QCU7_ENSVE|nr:hypothetical protein OPV22_001114 [Ensete ventricosum]